MFKRIGLVLETSKNLIDKNVNRFMIQTYQFLRLMV